MLRRLLKLSLGAGLVVGAVAAIYRLLAWRQLDHPVADGRHTLPPLGDPAASAVDRSEAEGSAGRSGEIDGVDRDDAVGGGEGVDRSR